LASSDSTRNPTRIYLTGNAIRIGWGGGVANCASTTNDVPLTGTNVTVSSLVFTNLTSGVLTKHIQFTYTISSQTYEGSAEIRSH
jgi:hypothetical protein